MRVGLRALDLDEGIQIFLYRLRIQVRGSYVLGF